jgi:hypothetical protein
MLHERARDVCRNFVRIVSEGENAMITTSTCTADLKPRSGGGAGEKRGSKHA